jgi:hypothetical protein
MSELRCKPGDLAIVIKANYPSNLGRIVRVVALSQGEGDLVYPKEQVTWLVTCQQPMTWYMKSKRYQRKKGPVPDAQLQPIRGVPIGQDTAKLIGNSARQNIRSTRQQKSDSHKSVCESKSG